MKLFFTIFFSIFIHIAFAQDVHFSQFTEAPLLNNPALAGVFSGDVRVNAIFKTQWSSVTVPYKTGLLSVEYKKHVGQGDDFATFGGQVIYDKAGSINLSTTQFLPVFNYHKSLNQDKNKYLSLGFMGGLVQRSLDRSKITTNNQFDGIGYNGGLSNGESFPKNSYSYIDASVGLSYNSQIGEGNDDDIYLGIAYHHLNKTTKANFYATNSLEMQPKWVASAGFRMSLSDRSYFTLQANYSKQSVYSETVAGGMFSTKLASQDEEALYTIHYGAFIRWGDAVIPVIKLEKKPVSLALSYDANISKLKTASNTRGGFELSLSYQKYTDKDNSSSNAVRCPRF
jgi:type IX secretion system PorP/SprF family membrane protein